MEIYTLWFIIFVIVLVIKAAIGICFCIRRREQRREIRERNLANNNNSSHQNWTSTNQVFVVRSGKFCEKIRIRGSFRIRYLI